MKSAPDPPRKTPETLGLEQDSMEYLAQWPVITFLGMMVAFGLVLLAISIQDNLKA